MSDSAEIRLPRGTKYVTVEDIPGLIADALHPESGDRDEMTISYLVKTSHPAGHRSNPGDLSDLGTKLSPADWDYLHRVWRALARYKDGITATSWATYASAFDSAPDKPSWHLTPVWVNPATNNPLLRGIDEEEQRAQLHRAILAKQLQAYSSGMTKLAPVEGTFPLSRILIDDFIGYVQALQVRVVEDNPKSAVKSRDEMGWIALARTEGQRIHTNNPKLSIDAIAKQVHGKFRTEQTTGRGGKIPSPSTIKRHALKGIKKQGIAPNAPRTPRDTV